MTAMCVMGQPYHRGLSASGSGSPGSRLMKNNTIALEWNCLTDVRPHQKILKMSFFQYLWHANGSLEEQLRLIPGGVKPGLLVANPTWKLE